MRFIVENFGPIKKADVKLKNLNIFIGKNSSGKSYLAYLIWALLSVEPNWELLTILFNKYVPNDLIEKAMDRGRKIHDILEKKLKDEFESYVEKTRKIEDELGKRFKSLIIDVFREFDGIWGRNLEELLKDVFLIDNLGELVRVGSERAKVTICDDNCKNRIVIEFNKDGLKSYVDERVFKVLNENFFTSVFLGEPMLLTIYYEDFTYNIYFYKNLQAIDIIPISFECIFDNYSPYSTTFIAPDGRTGLIRSIEAYNYALMTKRVVINEVDKLFMRDYTSLYPKTKDEEIGKIADFLEGKLGIKFFLKREQPRYTVKVNEVEMPIQRAPSGYRELAPLIYSMRYILNKGNLIFIEEPEAHLHPDAQVIVTRALAGLSRHCYVIVTTHSVTVLDEISNLLKLKNISNDVKRRFGYEEWEGLSPKEVGIFLFSDGDVHELGVYEDGIEESDLDRVTLEIANLHAKVEAEYEHSKRLQTQG